jgi:colanic acid/amylovoran biosynthesis glycosyltransferase
MLTEKSGRILLVLPLGIYRVGQDLFIDTQACNGLRLWLDNFDAVTLMGPEIPQRGAPPDTSNSNTVINGERLTIVPLPNSRMPHQFIANISRTSSLLRKEMMSANYLHFAIGGLWGDWAAVAAIIAHRSNLKYAVWTDRVESSVERFANRSRRGIKKAYWAIGSFLMERLERRVIRRSSLGLFNGTDCFDAYATLCPNPHLVFNIATGTENIISAADLSERLSARKKLRIAYAGRAHIEKGIFDWIDSLSKVTFDFEAAWYGDGPELEKARSRVASLGLSDKVKLLGSIDHKQAMKELKSSDIFLFCHKTLESPRNLIEALQCGLPIVGYGTRYSQSLIEENGGGALTGSQDVTLLSDLLNALASDPDRINDLSQKAMVDGARFTDERIFKHRSDLMRTIPKQTYHEDETMFSAEHRKRS